MKIEFDDWQKEVLECQAKRILICKGRQIGGTTTLAKKAADRLAHEKIEIIVVSISEEQAQLVVMMVLNFLTEYYPKLVSKKKTDMQKSKIKLKNGSVMKSRPVGTTGDSIRGFTGGILWLNEGSRIPEFAIEAGKPILLTTAGEIWMDSTPHGKSGYFWNSFQNKNGIWKVFSKNSVDAMNERRISASWTEEQRDGALKMLEEEKLEMTALQFGQEYLGLFMEDLMRFFDDDLIKKCCIGKRREPRADGIYYAGHDIARMGGDSFTAQIVAQLKNGKYMHVESYSEKKLLMTRNYDLILQFEKKWLPKKIGIDAGSGSMGVMLLDFLRQSEISRKIVPMNNRQITLEKKNGKEVFQRMFKEDMYDNLKAMMENKEIDLLDDEKVRISLASVQMEFVKDSHDNTKVRIFGTDTHIAEGLIRAAWLAKKEKFKEFHIYWA